MLTRELGEVAETVVLIQKNKVVDKKHGCILIAFTVGKIKYNRRGAYPDTSKTV